MNSIKIDKSVILIYFLLDRSLQGLSIISIPWINFLYVNFGKVVFVYILFLYFSQPETYRPYRKLIRLFTLSFVTLFCSTIIMDGNIMRYFSMLYPVMGLALFSAKYSKDKYSILTLIHSVSILYLILAFLNLALLLINPQGFGVSDKGGYSYFLGGENLIGYPLMLGFLANSIDYLYLKNKRQYYLYVFSFLATNLIVFSASSVTTALLVLLIVFIPPINKIVNFFSCKIIFCLFILFFLFIVVGFSYIENIPVLNYLIEEVLGKDLTFTGRTYIWLLVIPMILESIIWGHGVRETMNLFYIHQHRSDKADLVGTFSAHNQFLQSFYEGGIIYIILCLYIIFFVGKLIDSPKCNYRNRSLYKAVLLSIMMMYTFEAPGIYILFTSIIFITICTNQVLHTQDQ